MSKEHNTAAEFGNQHTTAAMAPQDTYQAHDNGPVTHSRRGSSLSKIEYSLNSSAASSGSSLSRDTEKTGSKRASTAPPDAPLPKKQKVTHRLIVPDSQPLKEKPIDAYRDAIEEPLGNSKDEDGKCLTCIKHNRACKGTAVHDRFARNKTTKRCDTCMPQQNAHCGRICYWKDSANGIYTYEDAQDYHKGIRNPKNSRDGRHVRAAGQQGSGTGSAGFDVSHASSNYPTYSTSAGTFSSGFTPVNGQSSGVRRPVAKDNGDDGDSDDDSVQKNTMDEPEDHELDLEDGITRLFKNLEAHARVQLATSMRGILPSDAQVYFAMAQLLFVEKRSMTRQIYAGLWKRLQSYHVQIVQGSSNRLVAVPQQFDIAIRGSGNIEGKGKDKATK